MKSKILAQLENVVAFPMFGLYCFLLLFITLLLFYISMLGLISIWHILGQLEETNFNLTVV